MLKLSTGLLYECLEYAVRKFDGAELRAKVLSEFSGSLCVDEIHLGHRVVLLASERPVSIRSKIRTNNHVERCNRVLR